MATDIGDLQIKIKASASGAYKPIENLVKQLENLSSTINRIDANRFSTLANSLDRFGVSVKTLSGVKTSDFTRISNNLNKLANINYPGLNASANGLFTITNALSGLNVANGNIDSISRLASAISRLGYKSVDKAVQNMPQLSAAFSQLIREVSALPQINQSIINFTSALANLANQGAKVGSSSNSLINALNGTHTASQKASKSTWSLARAFGKFYASYFLVIRGIKGLWGSIETTGDYVESFNYFTVAFGKIASEWDKNWEKYGSENAKNYSNAFVSSLNASLRKISGVKYDPQTGLLSETGLKNLGLNLKEVTQYAAQLSSMMNAVGQNGETTLATTNAFVKLAGDISSLFNIDYEEASSTLQSVMQGQSRAGYKFGWDTTMAALQATADKFDLSKPVSEMIQMEKQQLRILTILEQSKVAWGDQANTMSSLSNQIRLLKNNMSEMSMMLGQLFIPVLTNVLPVLNGMSIAIKRLLGDISSILGIQMKPENFSQGYNAVEEDIDSVTDSLDNLEDATNKTKRGLRGFDELNIIGTGAGIEATNETSNELSTIDLTQQILDSTKEYNRVWNEAYAQMENRAQEFADKISDYLEPIRTIFEDLSIGDYFKLGEDTSGLVIGIFDFISNAIENVDWYTIGENIGNFIGAIDWTTIFSNIGDIIFGAIEGALDVWQGAFDASPIETSIITAVALLTWSGIPLAIVKSMAKAFTVQNFTSALSSVFAIGGSVPAVEVIGTKIIEIVEGIIEDEFGKKVLDAMAAGLFIAVGAGAGFVLGGPAGAIVGGLITLIIGAFSGEEYGNTAFTAIGEWFKENVVPWFTKEKWQEIGVAAGTAIGEKLLDFELWWDNSKIKTWFDNSVKPWFTKEKWITLGKNAGISIGEKLMAFESWWDNSKITQWWNNSVLPWFSKDRWGNLGNQAKESIKNKWEEFSTWWNNNAVSKWYNENVKPFFTKEKWSWSGIKTGMSEAFNNAIDAVKKIWNYFANWLNEKLTFQIPSLEVDTFWGKETIFNGVTIDLGKIPTFMNGGFVPKTADLFMANENRIPELVGTVGGKPAVASGKEITGISDAVYSTGQTTAELLNTAVGLLNIIAQKEFGVTNEQISSAAIGGIKEYANRNKKMPFPMYI